MVVNKETQICIGGTRPEGVTGVVMTKSILVIDDEGLVTTSLKQLLKKAGYNVDIANNAQTAMNKVKENDFDLIISDIRMPKINGVEVVKEIRAYLRHAGKPSVPEILITGYADKEVFEEAQKLKVADYIYKPFNINDLSLANFRICRRKSLSDRKNRFSIPQNCFLDENYLKIRPKSPKKCQTQVNEFLDVVKENI